MKYEIVTLQEKKIVGIQARTGNEDSNMQMIIGGLWQQYYQGNICQQIEHKMNEFAYGIYSDYRENTYLVTVGAEVSEVVQKEGIELLIIPQGTYAKFQVVGDMVKAVANAWGEIWTMDLKRTYQADFEEYVAYDGVNATINIYIAIEA